MHTTTAAKVPNNHPTDISNKNLSYADYFKNQQFIKTHFESQHFIDSEVIDFNHKQYTILVNELTGNFFIDA